MARGLCIGVVIECAEYLPASHQKASAKTPSGGVPRKFPRASDRSLDGLEQVAPSAAERASQIDQDAESGSDTASFKFLIMPAAEVHLLRNLLLSQAGAFPQTGEIATKGKQMRLRE